MLIPLRSTPSHMAGDAPAMLPLAALSPGSSPASSDPGMSPSYHWTLDISGSPGLSPPAPAPNPVTRTTRGSPPTSGALHIDHTAHIPALPTVPPATRYLHRAPPSPLDITPSPLSTSTHPVLPVPYSDLSAPPHISRSAHASPHAHSSAATQ